MAKSIFTFAKDTLRNLASGLATSRDKSSGSHFYFQPMDSVELEAMYRGDWMARKAVDIPAFDSVRAWRNWQATAEQIEEVEETERHHQIQLKVLEAMVLARLHGGAALVMGVGTDDPATELKPERIKQGDLRYVHVMDRFELTVSEMRKDPEDPYFREPVSYQLNLNSGSVMNIHPSRVVVFGGAPMTGRDRHNQPWGDSILDAIADAVKNATLSQQTVAQLLNEAKVDVIKVPNLMDNLATKEYANLLIERFNTAGTIKSVTNAFILDSEEEYEQKQLTFSTLPEILQTYLLIVSGAADVPATRFLGQSPNGLNATGDADLKNYYDRIEAEQNLKLRPTMHRLDEVVIWSTFGSRDKSIHYTWTPLLQKDPKDLAEIESKRADTFSKFSATGLMPSAVLSKALENAMVESGQYPGIEAAIEKFGSVSEGFDPDAPLPGDVPEVDPNDPEAVAAAAAGKGAPPPKKKPDLKVVSKDAEPRTLYVRRDVLNGAQIRKWAKAQGFTKMLEAKDMHVTLAYSKTPVDWIKAGSAWSGDKDGNMEIVPGGPRVVEPLGPKGAIVLHFAASELSWRHEDIIRSTGAVWKWEGYQPHITITYEGGDIDLSKVTPYQGKILLGPEIFEEIVEDWEKGKE